MLPKQMCQTVTRIRVSASGEDAYGNPVPGTPATLDITGCSLQPLQGQPSSETNGANFDQVVNTWKLFAPPGTDLNTNDRIQQGALDLEVFGTPVTWPGVDGQPHHVEAMLKLYGG